MTLTQISAPFGARKLSAGMLAAQQAVASCAPAAMVDDKWRLLRALTDARQAFRLSDRAIAVLSALLSFLPSPTLGLEGAIVFPSNRKLSDRAHGISESTLRRAIAQLVEAGLVIRRDSPNGKRYPKGNDPAEAFGFDLGALAARADEIEAAAAAVKAERERERQARARITVLGRDIRKAAEYLLQATDGTHEGAMTALEDLALRLGQRPRSVAALEEQAYELGLMMARLAALTVAQESAAKSAPDKDNCQDMHANPVQNDGHIQDSNPEISFEREHSETGEGRSVGAETDTSAPGSRERSRRQPGTTPLAAGQRFDVATVIAACPSLREWAGFAIRDWPDLTRAAETVRPALGISPSAWMDAVDAMGETGAAVTLATILERAESIRTPGGYLRSLVAKAMAGKFSPAPIVVSLLKARARATPAAGLIN